TGLMYQIMNCSEERSAIKTLQPFYLSHRFFIGNKQLINTLQRFVLSILGIDQKDTTHLSLLYTSIMIFKFYPPILAGSFQNINCKQNYTQQTNNIRRHLRLNKVMHLSVFLLFSFL